MSLLTDPLYLIHISRIKLLRVDERGERVISFSPTVMSDDYVRLAAPVYPEMQYCYSPGHESHLSDSKLTTSPRTTKRTYRHRKTQQKQQFPSIAVPPNVRPKRRESSTTESEEEELMDLEHKEYIF